MGLGVKLSIFFEEVVFIFQFVNDLTNEEFSPPMQDVL
jgi:hypothetical protein